MVSDVHIMYISASMVFSWFNVLSDLWLDMEKRIVCIEVSLQKKLHYSLQLQGGLVFGLGIQQVVQGSIGCLNARVCGIRS